MGEPAGPSSSSTAELIPIDGIYVMVGGDNGQKYMKKIGINVLARKLGDTAKIIAEIKYNKDTEMYFVKFTVGSRIQESRFKMGVPFNERTIDGRDCRSVFKIKNSNTLIQEQRWKGKLSINTFEFKGDQLLATLRVDNVVATQIYQKMKVKGPPRKTSQGGVRAQPKTSEAGVRAPSKPDVRPSTTLSTGAMASRKPSTYFMPIAGIYRRIKSEHGQKYMKRIGVGFFTRKIRDVSKTIVEISHNDFPDVYYVRFQVGAKVHEMRFMLGLPFNEHTIDGRDCQTIIKIKSPNTLIQEQRWQDKLSVNTFEFRGDQIIATLKVDDVTCTLIFQKLQTSAKVE